uniref:Putative secreted protein n=1 Tax=Anopheles darlingi TaxID=43151 RepID=A0A2M4DJH1_ANODA
MMVLRLMVSLLQLLVSLLVRRLLIVVVRVGRVTVRTTEQGRTRTLPVKPTLIVFGLVRTVTVRFDPQDEQNDQNDGNQGARYDTDDHGRPFFGLRVNAATLVLR